MKRNYAYKYEIRLNGHIRKLLAQHAGVARFAFNWGLGLRISLYETEKKSTNAIEQHKLLNSLKQKEFPWMYEVSKCAPQEALRDLDRAFHNFFRGLKSGVKIGYPAFKKKGHRDSFRLTGTIQVHPKAIQLPRLGKIPLKEETKVKGKILSATVSRECDRWFVSIAVEDEIADPQPVQGPPVGIDLGLSAFVTTSDGDKVAPERSLNKSIKRLRRLSRNLTRKQKGSNNRRKSASRISALHRKIKNRRLDFQHKLSTRLSKTKSVIIVEDLNVKEMLQNKRLSRHISDAGWSNFLRMLEYKTEWYGSLLKVPRYYPSSKQCSCCKQINQDLLLSERNWTCRSCAMFHDRDINAAKNILNYYTGSSPGIYACRDSSDGASQKLASYESMKQEVTNGIFVHKL